MEHLQLGLGRLEMEEAEGGAESGEALIDQGTKTQTAKRAAARIRSATISAVTGCARGQ